MQNEVFLWQQNGPRFFSSELFSANEKKPAAYAYADAPEKGPMSG